MVRVQAEKLVRYTRWANDLVFSHIQSMTKYPERVALVIAHIVRAEEVWLSRLREVSAGPEPIWPEWDFNTSNSRRLAVEQGLLAFVCECSENNFDTEITYTTSRGDEFKTLVIDIFNQLIIHGGYHRGQVMELLRSAGAPTTNTDFITFTRAAPGR